MQCSKWQELEFPLESFRRPLQGGSMVRASQNGAAEVLAGVSWPKLGKLKNQQWIGGSKFRQSQTER